MSTRSTRRTRTLASSSRPVVSLSIAAAAAVLLFSIAPAGPPPVPQVVGDWDGFYVSVALGGPDTRPVALSIDDQRKRRVVGELSIGDPNEIGDPNLVPGCDYPVSGGLSAKGKLALGGEGCGAEVAAHAGFHDFGRSGAILDGTLYWTPGPDDSRLVGGSGHLILLRPYEGELCDNVAGHWTGQAVSDVTGERFMVQADFIIDPDQRTGFFGRMSFSMGRETLFEGAVLGTNNNVDHGTLIIGGGPAGVLRINGEHIDPSDPDMPAVIRGAYLTRFVDGTEDFGTLQIEVDPTNPN